jgi:lipopolysaccharide exporter
MSQASLLKSGFWTTYGAAAARGLALISNLILARLLLPTDYGVIGVAYIFWAFANLFTQGTLDSFVVYRGLEDRKALNTAYTVSWIIGGSLALGLIAASPAIAHFFEIPALTGVLSLFSVNLLLSFLYTFKSGILQRQMRYRELAQITLLASILRLAVSTGAAACHLGYWSFVMGDLAYWLLSFLLVSRVVDMPLKLALDPQARRAVVVYCLGAVGSSLGFYLNANFDSLLVGKLLGQEQLGYYNFAYQITMAACIILSQATQQLGTSVFARLETQGDRQQSLQQLMGQMAFLGAPLFGLLYLILNPSVITFLFDAKWVPACVVIPWLLSFAYCRLLTSPLAAMLAATGKPSISAQANLIIAPIAILSFAIGAFQFGILGVAVAAAIVLGGGWTIYWWWLGSRSLAWNWLPFLLPALRFGGMAIAALFATQGLSPWLRPLGFCLLYLVLSFWWARPYLAQYQALVGLLQRKFANRAA